MSFPRSEGQIPIYYNSFNTGRPQAAGAASGYVSGYIDLDGTPRYPFGYGLSYTEFAYSNLQLDQRVLRGDEKISVTLDVTNTGRRAGEEIVQLYLHDRVASVVRPVRELKDFRKIRLEPGQTQTLHFVIDRETLSFYNAQLHWGAEAGQFDLMIGASAADIRLRTTFELAPTGSAGTHSMLHTQGTRWVQADGTPIALKGVNLGNWLLPEFWMMGYGENAKVNDQCTLEAVLDQRFGVAQRQRLIQLHRDHWITPRDWDLIPQFGLNLVRLPFLWSVVEDENQPRHLRADAWHYLDQAIEQARARGLYVILDLHGAVGAQGTEHHSGCAGKNLYWSTPEYQERTDWLWRQIAARYKDEPVVAGYDLLNEPWGSSAEQLAEVVKKLYTSIREVDAKHIILLPDHPKGIAAYGNPRAQGMRNVAFETHPYPGFFGWAKPGMPVHRDWLGCLPEGGGVCDWQKRMAALDTPLYIGEFQPWADLEPELSGQITRASFDRYAQLGWASTAWSYKKFSRAGGDAPVNWGLVTNAKGAALPEIDFEKASLSEIEAFFKLFGSIPYQVNTPVMKWMNSAIAPQPFQAK